MTKSEGVGAVNDAIEFVKKHQPLKPLYFNKYMSKVSRIHAQECSASNSVNHKSKKGERPSHRLKRFGHLFFGGA